MFFISGLTSLYATKQTEKKDKKEEEKKIGKKPEVKPEEPKEPVIARKVRRQAAAEEAKEKSLHYDYERFEGTAVSTTDVSARDDRFARFERQVQALRVSAQKELMSTASR